MTATDIPPQRLEPGVRTLRYEGVYRTIAEQRQVDYPDGGDDDDDDDDPDWSGLDPDMEIDVCPKGAAGDEDEDGLVEGDIV